MTIPLISPQGCDYSYLARGRFPLPTLKTTSWWRHFVGHWHSKFRWTLALQDVMWWWHHKEQRFQVEDVIHRWLLLSSSPCKLLPHLESAGVIMVPKWFPLNHFPISFSCFSSLLFHFISPEKPFSLFVRFIYEISFIICGQWSSSSFALSCG